MSRSYKAFAAILIYVLSVTTVLAADCNQFRADLQAIQQQVRTIEFDKGNVGINVAQEASRVVKTMCLDPLSSLDMTAFGFTPGAAAIVTRLAGVACKRLSQEISNKIGQVTQQASQGINNITGQINNLGNGQVGDILGQINNGGSAESIIGNQIGGTIGNGMGGPVPPMQEPPGMFSKASGALQSGWANLKKAILPGS